MEHGLTTPVRSKTLPEIIDEDFKGFWKEDIDIREYHKDKSFMSSSLLKTLLGKSPLHFLEECRKGEDDEEDDSGALRIGTIVHLAVLEPQKFKDSYKVMPDFGNRRLKITREKEEEWREKHNRKGTIIVNEKEFDMVNGIVNSILSYPLAKNLLTGGIPEISGYFRDPGTGVKCRIRPDIYNADQGLLIDLKTARDASQYGFAKAVDEYMYHISMAFYKDGIEAITGKAPNVCTFLVVEKDPPYACAVYPMIEEDIALGRAWYQHGLAIYKECMTNDVFPSYQHQAEDLRLPNWSKTRSLPLYDFEQYKTKEGGYL